MLDEIREFEEKAKSEKIKISNKSSKEKKKREFSSIKSRGKTFVITAYLVYKIKVNKLRKQPPENITLGKAEKLAQKSLPSYGKSK